MDGWMISFTLTPRYSSDMQVTTTISILVALITVVSHFLRANFMPRLGACGWPLPLIPILWVL
jgi:hypothetical protein